TLLRIAVIRGGVIPASRIGKLKTLTQNFAVGFYILPLPEALFLPRDMILGLAIILTLYSGYEYFRLALRRTP
ncbi:MAG: CDP-alcohol phosphatidyltransferase family protein, partial [bacterium]